MHSATTTMAIAITNKMHTKKAQTRSENKKKAVCMDGVWSTMVRKPASPTRHKYSTHIAEITEDNGNSAAFTCVLPLYINQPERAKNEEYEKKGKSISVLGSMFFSYTELLLLIVRTCAG